MSNNEFNIDQYFADPNLSADNFAVHNQSQPTHQLDYKKACIPNSSSQDYTSQRLNQRAKKQEVPPKQPKERTSSNQYPTKNFLPLYRNAHFSQIKKWRPSILNEPRIGQMSKRAHICMDDYRYLYAHPCLRECWRQMFKNKNLYRETMKSRAKHAQRQRFATKLEVFQRAFRRQEFSRINQ